MKNGSKSSLYNVGHRRAERISARVSHETAHTKPPHLSWGNYIDRLVRRSRHHGLYDEEVVRYCAWCAVSLDRLCIQVSRGFPDDASLTDALRADRLVLIAALTDQIAALRAVMEEKMNAR
jgi:hypothetical protein